MKSRVIRIAVLLCVSTFSISVINPTHLLAHTKRPTAARRQQALVKRINQQAIRFYRTFIRQSIRNAVSLDCELNGLLEDLLLGVDALTDPRYVRHNLVIVLQVASDVEEELLWRNTSSDVVLAWSRLHADLDRLAKIHGITWSEAVVTNELIAASSSNANLPVVRPAN